MPLLLPPWLDAPRYECLSFLIQALDGAGIASQATGGLAGNLWGSVWPLHDIDLDVATVDLDRLERRFAPFVLSRGRLVDDEFDLDLLHLRRNGVDIEIAGADGAWIRSPAGTWAPLARTLERAVERPLVEACVRTQRLEDLLAYKRVLGRTADVLDLQRLWGDEPGGGL